MTDLGTLPGQPDSSASAINDRGQIIGWSGTGDWRGHAVLWRSGTITDLGTLHGWNVSEAVAINERGQIVGDSARFGEGEGLATIRRAFLWQDGTMVDLGTGGPARRHSRAAVINERGEILGQSYTLHKNGSTSELRGFFWENGKLAVFAAFWPGDISDRGQIVGPKTTVAGARHAALWRRGNLTDLGTLPGRRNSSPAAINEQDQIVGWSGADPYSGGHAVLWTLKRG
jgi:probable HAF family extracellular repeat protein